MRILKLVVAAAIAFGTMGALTVPTPEASAEAQRHYRGDGHRHWRGDRHRDRHWRGDVAAGIMAGATGASAAGSGGTAIAIASAAVTAAGGKETASPLPRNAGGAASAGPDRDIPLRPFVAERQGESWRIMPCVF